MIEGSYEVVHRQRDGAVLSRDVYSLRARSAQLQAEMLSAKLEMETAIYSVNFGAVPKKCPGCGSHEWRQHNNVRVCAYCRSGQ